MDSTEPKDATDWLLKGDRLKARGLWEEALGCYRRSLALSCGDSVGWREGLAAERGMKECLPRLTGLLGLVFEGFSARSARDAEFHAVLAQELMARHPAQTLDALRDLLNWAVSLEAHRLAAVVQPCLKTPGAVPVEILRRYLADVAKRMGLPK